MAAGDGDLDFYPAYCFKESPTHFTWVKMAAVDVHRLKRRQGFGESAVIARQYPGSIQTDSDKLTTQTRIYSST